MEEKFGPSGEVHVPAKFENADMVIEAYENDIKNIMSTEKVSFEDAAERVMERNYHPEKAANEKDGEYIREALDIMREKLSK